MMAEVVGKQLELLKEIDPRITRVALLGNPANPNYGPLVQHARDAARMLGMPLQLLEARDPGAIDDAFAATTAAQADAVVVLADTVLLDHRTRIVDHARRRRLPTPFTVSEFVEAGGLLAYGPSLTDGFRRAAAYVDRILKGAKPADLPIGQPTTFELVINHKTAKALGLTIPGVVLQRADRIIETGR
jgi:putative ABC transport system substrate-binding protein